jgi:hypothetical protein
MGEAMTQHNDGGPVFPQHSPTDYAKHGHFGGMSLLDAYAIAVRAAMGTWTPGFNLPTPYTAPEYEAAARKARSEWVMAEARAMLAAREVKP